MRKPFPNIALCVLSIVIVLALLETALAFFWPQKLRHRPFYEQYDPTMGWVNKPFKDDDVRFEFARNRYFHVTNNSGGLRGKEADIRKRPGVKRILFIGDSFFWGYGVENNEVLTEVLQRAAGSSVEVLNGAVTGYGTDQELLWLKNVGLHYQPDIVVLGFFPANDVKDVATSVRYHYPKPLFALEGNNLVLKNVPVPRTAETDRKGFSDPQTWFGKLKKFLRYHTHTYNFIVRRLNSRPDWRLFLLNLGLAEEYTNKFEGIPLLTNPPSDVEKVMFRLVGEMAALSAKAGAKFLLVFIPVKERDPQGTVRYDEDRAGAFSENTYYSTKVREFSRKTGIPVLDLLPQVRERHRRGEMLYNLDRYDHHWTAEGHRFAAGAIYDFLVRERWLGSGGPAAGVHAPGGGK